MKNTIYISKGGFTLAELTAAIIIISIVSFTVISSISPLSSAKLRLAAQKIQSDIRYTQSLADSIQKRTEILFNAAADSYTVYIEQSPGSWITAKDRLGSNNFTVQLNTGAYSGVDITNVYFNGTGNGLVFDKWGNPYGYTGGAASPLTNPAGIRLNGILDISVRRATGRVTIQNV